MYVGLSAAASHFGVTPRTIIRWCDESRVHNIRTKGGKRRIEIEDIGNIPKRLHQKSAIKSTSSMSTKPKSNICYCRVSSSKQREDLERQVSMLSNQFPQHTIIKDIGSGLNFKRKGLISILEQAQEGLVSEVVVASKDRLCRFGFELIEWILTKYNVKLVVLEHIDKSPEQEFTEDILAVMQVFSCRWNGRRRYQSNNQNKKIQAETQPTSQIDSMEMEPSV